MKLIFTKDTDKEINVQLQKGTVVEEFSYTEMISQLLTRNVFDDTDYTNLSVDEQTKVNCMLDKIRAVFQEVEENEADDKEKE